MGHHGCDPELDEENAKERRERGMKLDSVLNGGVPQGAPPKSGQDHLYASLRSVLDRAYRHAAAGKGKERHASGEAFEDQPIVRLGEFMRGSIAFNVGQAAKKAMEAERLTKERAIDELIGAINYLAGAVIILERKAPEASQ